MSSRGLGRRYFDARWIGTHGIGRFAAELRARMTDLDDLTLAGKPSRPFDPLALSYHLRARRAALYFSPGYNCPLGYDRPFIFTVHDLNHLVLRRGSDPAKRAYYRHVIRPGIRRARAVLTVSEFSRSALLEWSGVSEERVINVSNGVSRAFVAEGAVARPCADPYVLAIGARKWHKNLEGTLEGYARSARCREASLVITGEPQPHLLSLCRRLKLEARVRFTGAVSDEELAALYRGAALFVFVSHYEGFGLPVLEAMACGTPVVTSQAASLPEVAGGAAQLVDPNSPEAIGEAIRALLDDRALRAELTRAGLARAAQFTWEATTRNVERAIARCV